MTLPPTDRERHRVSKAARTLEESLDPAPRDADPLQAIRKEIAVQREMIGATGC